MLKAYFAILTCQNGEVTLASGMAEMETIVDGYQRNMSVRRTEGRVRLSNIESPVEPNEDSEPNFTGVDLTMAEAEFLHDVLSLMLGR